MEVARRFIAQCPSCAAAYLTLQLALMRRYVARGGTAEGFCEHLAPVFRRRWGFLLIRDEGEPTAIERLDRAA